MPSGIGMYSQELSVHIAIIVNTVGLPEQIWDVINGRLLHIRRKCSIHYSVWACMPHDMADGTASAIRMLLLLTCDHLFGIITHQMCNRWNLRTCALADQDCCPFVSGLVHGHCLFIYCVDAAAKRYPIQCMQSYVIYTCANDSILLVGASAHCRSFWFLREIHGSQNHILTHLLHRYTSENPYNICSRPPVDL